MTYKQVIDNINLLLNWSSSRVITRRTHLTATQIRTPGLQVELVPAPGPGKVITDVTGFMKMNYGSEGFDGAIGTLQVGYTVFGNDSTLFEFTQAGLLGSFGWDHPIERPMIDGMYDMKENEGLSVLMYGTNYTTGNGSVDLYISYRVVKL
jgi:hypothetical protein